MRQAVGPQEIKNARPPRGGMRQDFSLNETVRNYLIECGSRCGIWEVNYLKGIQPEEMFCLESGRCVSSPDAARQMLEGRRGLMQGLSHWPLV
jgi:hypothetical protein